MFLKKKIVSLMDMHTHTNLFIFPTNIPEYLPNIKCFIEQYKGKMSWENMIQSLSKCQIR